MLGAWPINCVFAGLEVADAWVRNAIRLQIAPREKNARAGIQQWDACICPLLAQRRKIHAAETKIATLKCHLVFARFKPTVTANANKAAVPLEDRSSWMAKRVRQASKHATIGAKKT